MTQDAQFGDPLTKREREVMSILARGIHRKLGIHSRAELVLHAQRLGIA